MQPRVTSLFAFYYNVTAPDKPYDYTPLGLDLD